MSGRLTLCISIAAILVSISGLFLQDQTPRKSFSDGSEQTLRIRTIQVQVLEILPPDGVLALLRMGSERVGGVVTSSGELWSQIVPSIELYDNSGSIKVKISLQNNYWGIDEGEPVPEVYVDNT